MRKYHQGQSMLEYSVLAVIIVAALITMQVYIKRGIQGRWKSSVDDLGAQYDPNKTSGNIEHHLISNSFTQVQKVSGIFEGEDGYFTMRRDADNSTETRVGSLTTQTGGLLP